MLEITLLTLRVGATAVALAALPGIWLGHVLARRRFPGKVAVRSLAMLPMVLPPVAVGLALLLLLGRDAPLGRAIEAALGDTILLTWQAAAIAAAVMCFPIVVLGAQQAFESVPRRLEQVAASLGATPRSVFLRVTLPLAARGILYGLVFAFARSLGEFGATILVAGRIPGETETLALAIYDRIQRFEDAEALALTAVSTAFAYAVTLAAELFLRADAR